MFLKVNKSKNYTYLQIVESYWEDGKSKHKVLANLGSFADLEGNPILKKLGKRFLDLAGEPVTTPLDLDMEEEGRFCYGDIVYRKLWDKFAIRAMIKKMLRRRRLKFDFDQALYLLVVDRLLAPRSKLATSENQDRYLNIEEVKLDHLYKVLDVLADSKVQIERHLFEKQSNLFNLKVDVVFFDLTTFHFESVRPDDLKDFGFSKAGKFNEVQVMLALLVDTEGRPVGFDLYPGNTFEGNTLVDALDKLKQRFSVRKLVFVADRGLNSGANLNLIREAGYEYVVSSPLKRKSQTVIDSIMDPEGYQSTFDEDGVLTFKYKWLPHEVKYEDEQGKKTKFPDHLLITWSAKRAERDFKNRQRQIDKAQKMLEGGKNIQGKKGAARYLKTEGKAEVLGLDQAKIDKDQKWDGYYGIQSFNKMDHQLVLQHYRGLWRIEDSFRVMKSTMDTRPVFHWTAKRIIGHFTLCFIAFLLERTLEYKLRSNKIELSPEKIKEALNSVEVSKVNIQGKPYYLKAKTKKHAGSILRAFRIKAIKNLTPVEEFMIE